MTPLAGRGVGASAARPSAGLTELIHPVDPQAFERDHWERAPLLVQRGEGQSDYYADLLSLDHVDQVLSLAGTDLDRIRVVMDGKETPVSRLASAHGHNALEGLFEQYRNGSTLIFNALEQRWEPLRRFAHQLGAELSARIQTNVYVTPAGNQGFAPHYDMHDVFVAQVHGSKHWRIASQPYNLPMRDRPYDKSQPHPEPDRAFDLSSGDLLYLPRGTVHWATSNDATSIHITIGVHPVLYADVIERAVKALFAQEAGFRRSLPIGFADDAGREQLAAKTLSGLLDTLRDRLSPDEIVADAGRRSLSIGLPSLRHHLTDLEHLDRIGPGTRVRRRPDLRWRLTITNDMAQLSFHNKVVQLPAHVADEVRYVADSAGNGCTAASIPGDLDEPGRIVLISTLVREGFLTLV